MRSATPMPSFIISGGRRCGTTSLYYWIKDHPGVYLPPERDNPYFIDAAVLGKQWKDVRIDPTAWEFSHGPEDYASRFTTAEPGLLRGDKCADLLYWEPAHPRLARLLPDTRYILVLRDPVARAWSHYWHEIAKGRETLDFPAALDAEEGRLTSDYGRFQLSYRTRGYYDLSLESFYRHVPESRTLILVLEEMSRDPLGHLARIHTFLGLNQHCGSGQAGSRHHPNWVLLPRPWTHWPLLTGLVKRYELWAEARAEAWVSAEPDRALRLDRKRSLLRRMLRPVRVWAGDMKMPAAIRLRLARDFAPHTAALEERLGRRIEAWR